MELFIIFGVPGAVMAYVIYTRHRERMEAIKRGVHAYRIPSAPKSGNLALALGLFVTGIGLAILLSGIGLWDRVDRDMITGGLILLFGGLALLLYWRMTAQDRDKTRKLYEKRLELYLQEIPKQVPAPVDAVQTAEDEPTVQAGEL